MTQQTEREKFEDGAWYWVEKEGWIGDPPTIAPARYSAGGDSWNSFSFSGIPTREVKVLEPCRRAGLEAKQAVQWPEPVAEVGGLDEYGPVLAWGIGFADLQPGAKLQQVRTMLQAAPAAPVLQPLTDEQIDSIAGGPCWAEDGIDPIMFARAIERAHGIGAPNAD